MQVKGEGIPPGRHGVAGAPPSAGRFPQRPQRRNRRAADVNVSYSFLVAAAWTKPHSRITLAAAIRPLPLSTLSTDIGPEQ